MKEKKIFIKGVLFGLLFCISFNMIINSSIRIYKRFILKDIGMERKIDEIKYIIDKYYVEDVKESELLEGAYQGVVSSLEDPYSYYMNSETFNKFMEETNGNYIGIGIIITIDEKGDLSIVDVFENSPAYKAGVRVNDKVLKVNNQKVNLENYSEAISMIKGKEGEKVKISLFRESENKIIEVDILRESIDVPTVSYKVLQDNIGYIKITQFDGVTFEQFKEAFDNLEDKNTKGLIIDLRDNPGGLLNIVSEITDLLVPKGIITYVEDKYGKKSYEYSDANFYNKPLVILVNGGSASASEILSGAVKDYGVGKLVGETTYGKGVVQNIYRLSDGSGIKVTIAKYYTPKGVCINGTGIEPDYFEKLDEGVIYNSKEDNQLNKALEVINNFN